MDGGIQRDEERRGGRDGLTTPLGSTIPVGTKALLYAIDDLTPTVTTKAIIRVNSKYIKRTFHDTVRVKFGNSKISFIWSKIRYLLYTRLVTQCVIYYPEGPLKKLCSSTQQNTLTAKGEKVSTKIVSVS